MPSIFQLSISLALQINPENPLITVIPVLQGEVMHDKATVNVNSKFVSAPFENCNLNQYFVYCFGLYTLPRHHTGGHGFRLDI